MDDEERGEANQENGTNSDTDPEAGFGASGCVAFIELWYGGGHNCGGQSGQQEGEEEGRRSRQRHD